MSTFHRGFASVNSSGSANNSDGSHSSFDPVLLIFRCAPLPKTLAALTSSQQVGSVSRRVSEGHESKCGQSIAKTATWPCQRETDLISPHALANGANLRARSFNLGISALNETWAAVESMFSSAVSLLAASRVEVCMNIPGGVGIGAQKGISDALSADAYTKSSLPWINSEDSTTQKKSGERNN